MELEITLYLNEIVYFKVDDKPITKYNKDHFIQSYWCDRIVKSINVYKPLQQVVIDFQGDTDITFYNVTWSIESKW